MKFRIVSAGLILLSFYGCRVEQQPTSFNETLIRNSNSSVADRCKEISQEALCLESIECQALYNEEKIFKECILIPAQDQIAEFSDDTASEIADLPEDDNIEAPIKSVPEEDILSAPISADHKKDHLMDKNKDNYHDIPSTEDNSIVSQEKDDKCYKENCSTHEEDQDQRPADEISKSCQRNDNKIIICHVPPGNLAAAHSICISERGWLNGHQNSHGKDLSRDYLGPCKSEDLQ